MARVRVAVGTRKGAFLLTSDEGRKKWEVSGPHFGGWEIYHVKGSPVDPNRVYASQSSGWFGQIIQRSSDGGKTWEPVGNKFTYEEGGPTTHKWYDGTPHPWEFARVWHLEPSLADADTVYAGVQDAGLFRSTDSGQSWQELSGLRRHKSGPDWHPGAGGLCLHTIILDPSRADRIYVDGTQLRYSDASYANIFDNSAATWATTAPALGALVPLKGYYSGAALLAGTAYGTEASGVRPSTAAEFSNRDAFVLSDGSGNDRFPVRGGTDAGDVAQPLTATEVRSVLEQAFKVMSRARAQIRQPLDSRAQVSISVVDTHGQVLGIVRAPDAPIFGIDVSLQKARTATFFSGPHAASDLQADSSADVRGFVAKVRTFLNDPTALTGTYAFADRSGGNLSRPYFPDGQVGNPNGPLSRPIAQWNPFTTGLQSALVIDNILQHVGYVTGASASDTPRQCTSLPDAAPGQKRLQNGIQIFPGSVPIYRGSTLVGGIGVSGDGIDQDDMISFLGLNNAGVQVGGIGNAPVGIRADNIVVNVSGSMVRLRYVNCPFAPFLDTSEQNVCQGL